MVFTPRKRINLSPSPSPEPVAERPSFFPASKPPSLPHAAISNAAPNHPEKKDEEEEDDYLSMTIPDPATANETLTQRARRKLRESEIRGRPKSKAELAREEAEKREAALKRSIMDAEAERSNRGLRMMKAMGFKPGRGLGKGEGKGGVGVGVGEGVGLEPIGLQVKADRAGIGHATEAEQKRKLEEGDGDGEGVVRKRVEVDPDAYRSRVREEREELIRRGQFYGAQKVLEGLDGKRVFGIPEEEIGGERKVPLRCINVLWRGLVRHREERERERRMRHDLETGLGARPRLPGYDRVNELDEEDKVAMGMEVPGLRKVKEKREIFEEESGEKEGMGEDEDEELAEFEALSFAERLDKVVDYLRKEYRYCFWCKYQYEDEEMEGCPGADEDSHG